MFVFLKENLFQFISIFVLFIILAYVVNITSIPDSIILFENEEFSIDTIAGVKLEEDDDTTIQASSELVNSYSGESVSKTYNLSLLGLNLKKITANVVKNSKVIPVGTLAGLKLYTEGVLVVGMSEIKGEDDKIYRPYEEAGIEQGDSILEINNVEVNSTEELIACVSRCKGEKIDITYVKDGNVLETQITPVKTDSNTYKIGLWVRDAEAGIGTITFYDSSSNSFAALGHGIQDIDTGGLVDISSGELVTAEILDIEKGQKDIPGKIEGTIEDSTKIGEIYSNTHFGIYGKTNNKKTLKLSNAQEVEVASRDKIKIGKASVICTLDGEERKEYEVEIKKIYINNNEDNKSMVVEVTDKDLLEKTGGIIQGMSGSPIIQNEKLIGALTHVLVSDPTKGYALFADTMISHLKEVE